MSSVGVPNLRAAVVAANQLIQANATGIAGLDQFAGAISNIRKFGAVPAVDCISAVMDAITQTTGPIIFDDAFKLTVTAADSAALFAAINRFIVNGSLVINISGEAHSFTAFVDITNPTAQNISIQGVESTARNIASIGVVTGGQGNWSVPVTLDDAVGVGVGDYLMMFGNTLTGTGRFKELAGCWVVTAVVGSVVTVTHTHQQTAWPAMTLTGGTVRPMTTVMRWAAGSRGIAIYGCDLKQMKDVVIAGSYDIAVTAPSDGPDDGLQVGSAPNTSDTGLNESHSIQAGSVYLTRVGVVEWPANGLQVLGGSVHANGFCCCGNGWRGAQSAGAGYVRGKFGGYVGNGSCGAEAEANGVFNAAGSVFAGNREQGVYAISGHVVANSGAYSGGNVTHGFETKNGGTIGADSASSVGNTLKGVNAISGSITISSGSVIKDNGDAAVSASQSGLVDLNGATTLTGGTVYDVDTATFGKVIQPDGQPYWGQETQILSGSTRKGGKWAATSLGDLTFSSDVVGDGSFNAVMAIKNNGIIYPQNDNSVTHGRASNRYSVIYAGTGTINTSDARTKQKGRALSEAENRAALQLKGLLKAFKFNDAVVEKGEAARWHFGVYAQEVIAAFEAEGLDATRYALLCYDEWDAEYDDDGVEVLAAGNRYGIRYEELLAFIIGAL